MNNTSRKTKIVATLGPASGAKETIGHLIAAGVDIFRLNFSHGSNDEKLEIIKTVRSLAKNQGRAIGIVADLQGPKIRTGRMVNGHLPLAKGDNIVITTEDIVGHPGLISTSYPDLPNDVEPGDR